MYMYSYGLVGYAACIIRVMQQYVYVDVIYTQIFEAENFHGLGILSITRKHF